MRLTRTVITNTPLERVFEYLSDFTSTTEWDPGTVRTSRVSGDGGVGTVYANTSRFNGRETALEYTVIEFEPPHRIVLRGVNRTVTAIDTITAERTDDGRTRVTYDANFTFRGIASLAAPFLGKAFRTLGDEAERGLQFALDLLGSADQHNG